MLKNRINYCKLGEQVTTENTVTLRPESLNSFNFSGRGRPVQDISVQVHRGVFADFLISNTGQLDYNIEVIEDNYNYVSLKEESSNVDISGVAIIKIKNAGLETSNIVASCDPIGSIESGISDYAVFWEEARQARKESSAVYYNRVILNYNNTVVTSKQGTSSKYHYHSTTDESEWHKHTYTISNHIHATFHTHTYKAHAHEVTIDNHSHSASFTHSHPPDAIKKIKGIPGRFKLFVNNLEVASGCRINYFNKLKSQDIAHIRVEAEDGAFLAVLTTFKNKIL